ncbi:hypothetical protein [Alphaentomopoxvirus acuprea]|uniref:Uncharacterized protein n=1 Tax=Alphaentomopoxvirus acuprea TaxID=62099 RepID=W6JPK0_9POXV|nr:hypothetical protein BA82_gp054 [Anomala cuprea entomopoxvirus]BAO49414.1 hypothetical protein [Anomala cuprea entomopoxvirus]
MFIEFNINSLKDRIRILSIFNQHGTIWCDGKKCEIITMSDFYVYIDIPFLRTDINELTSFNISYTKIGDLSLKNSISNTIIINFKDDSILTEKFICENNMHIITPENTNIYSISNTEENKNKFINFEFVKHIDTDYKLTEEEDVISKKLKVIKKNDGDLTIGYILNDNFTNIPDNNLRYSFNPSLFNDVSIIFKLSFELLNDFIKKLINTKSACIEIQFIETYVKMSVLRNDNIRNNIVDESSLKTSIIKIFSPIYKKYKIDLNHFSLLRKLNISISDYPEKDKKIYRQIQFNVIKNNENVIGMCIYPGAIREELKDELKKYFIFMPLEEY